MIQVDSSLAFGCLQQFREKKIMGLKLAEERYKKLAKEGIALKALPSDVTLGKTNETITVLCTAGFQTLKTSFSGEFFITKLIAVGRFEDPSETKFTLWKVKEILKIKNATYQVLTCTYHGYWEDKDE